MGDLPENKQFTDLSKFITENIDQVHVYNIRNYTIKMNFGNTEVEVVHSLN